MADHLCLIRATAKPTATTVFELTITQAFTNRMGNMHGGAIATVYDMCTTMTAAPLSRRDFWWFGGVSRTLSVTFMRPVKMGMRVIIESEVLQMGTRLGKQYLSLTKISLQLPTRPTNIVSNDPGCHEGQGDW